MGTSSSARGPKNSAPLVPSWADTDGAGLGPAPSDNRFTAFRTNLGRFVSTGDPNYLRPALGHYARNATGGSSVGPRRFGAMIEAGGALFATLQNLSEGGTGFSAEGAQVDLSSLNGSDTRVAIQALVQLLTPPNGDGEKINDAMQLALSESLLGMNQFDPLQISPDMLVNIITHYLSECIFQQIMIDADRAFQKADTLEKSTEAENALLQLVNAAVNKHMRPLFKSGGKSLSRTAVENIQKQALVAVWVEWEKTE